MAEEGNNFLSFLVLDHDGGVLPSVPGLLVDPEEAGEGGGAGHHLGGAGGGLHPGCSHPGGV